MADGCVRPASRPGGSQRCTRGGTLTTRTAFRRTIGGRLRHACITAGRISTLHTWRGAYDTDRLLADDWRTVASRLHHSRADLNAAHVAGRLRHGPPFGGRLADGCVTPASRPGVSQRCTRGGALTTWTAFWRTIGGRLRHACIAAGRISTLHTAVLPRSYRGLTAVLLRFAPQDRAFSAFLGPGFSFCC